MRIKKEARIAKITSNPETTINIVSCRLTFGEDFVELEWIATTRVVFIDREVITTCCECQRYLTFTDCTCTPIASATNAGHHRTSVHQLLLPATTTQSLRNKYI